MKKNMLLSVLLAALLALLATGCQGDGRALVDETLPGSGDLELATLPIYNGAAPDSPEHDAVVALHRLAKGGRSVYVQPFCSGTLIAPDVVLTAAHCLDVGKREPLAIKPGDVAIYVGDDPAQDLVQHLYVVSETIIHPAYDPYWIRNDVGLLRLAAATPEPVTPVAALPAELGFSSLDLGSAINIAGFGQTETGGSGLKLQVDVTLDGFGCQSAGCSDPGDAATQISYTQLDGGPCFGDSGGPAFVYRDAVPYVGGVTSYGDSECTLYGVSTRIDAYDAFISDFVGGVAPGPDCSANGVCNTECDAGADPDCSVEPPPSGDCGNGVCDAGESCDGRDGTAACEADCPGLTTGKPSSRFCYVGASCVGDGCP